MWPRIREKEIPCQNYLNFLTDDPEFPDFQEGSGYNAVKYIVVSQSGSD
jgi:hypothetical protein